ATSRVASDSSMGSPPVVIPSHHVRPRLVSPARDPPGDAHLPPRAALTHDKYAFQYLSLIFVIKMTGAVIPCLPYVITMVPVPADERDGRPAGAGVTPGDDPVLPVRPTRLR